LSHLRASFVHGAWRVEVLDTPVCPRSLEDRFAESAPVLHYPADPSKVWQLELEKSETAASQPDRDNVAVFVAACIASPDSVHETQSWSGPASRKAVLHRLAAHGQCVHGLPTLRATSAVKFVVSALLASSSLVAAVVRASLERADMLPGNKPWVAVFGDGDTRDGPALESLNAITAHYPVPVLVLGRPRKALGEIKQTLRDSTNCDVIVGRPLDFRALAAATPALAAALKQGLHEQRNSIASPSLIELAGITYRVLAGHVAVAWQRRNPCPSEVVYSQTGLADVSLLEAQQQALGATTIHLVHGVSIGKNFVGFSDAAVFQCRHDANWHETMGGYRRCVHAPMAAPPFVADGSGWLLLSNLVHSMNPHFRERGTAPELELLAAVAECARDQGVPAGDITWKPHPSFASQPASVRNEVLECVEALGFRRWPEDATLDLAKSYKVILSTRSTVLLDLLRMGKLGILVDFTPGPAGLTAVARMPLIARDAKQLLACVATTRDDRSYGDAYRRAWADIGPGMTGLSMEQIIDLARCHD
jgi:hypothetical protein